MLTSLRLAAANSQTLNDEVGIDDVRNISNLDQSDGSSYTGQVKKKDVDSVSIKHGHGE
jgi:hypothetical protein